MRLLRILAMMAATVMPAAARQSTGPHVTPPVPVAVTIDGIDLSGVSADSIRFELRSHVTADRNLKLKRVRFEEMYLGTLPIYLNPIDDRLQLVKGSAVELPRVPVTIYFRDLDSVEPLEDVVRSQSATITGKARLDLDLNLIEKVLSGGNVHADIPIAVTTPVGVPGGIIGQTAAIASLHAAQFALTVGSSALHALRQSQRQWEQEIRTHYIPALVIAESHYSIRLRTGERADFVVRGLGFRISEDKFVIPDEILEPWIYDTDVATVIQSQGASLVDGSRDLLVWPSGEVLDPNTARSLSKNTIHVEHKSGKTEAAHVPSEDKTVKIHLGKRDSDENYAILRFTRPEDKGTAIQVAPDQILQSQSWDRLTMFRANDAGKVEIIYTPAHRKDNRIFLEDSVDERAYGSLLIAPEGAIGMAQDEQSGIVLRKRW
jgi:hypothetical protein